MKPFLVIVALLAACICVTEAAPVRTRWNEKSVEAVGNYLNACANNQIQLSQLIKVLEKAHDQMFDVSFAVNQDYFVMTSFDRNMYGMVDYVRDYEELEALIRLGLTFDKAFILFLGLKDRDALASHFVAKYLEQIRALTPIYRKSALEHAMGFKCPELVRLMLKDGSLPLTDFNNSTDEILGMVNQAKEFHHKAIAEAAVTLQALRGLKGNGTHLGLSDALLEAYDLTPEDLEVKFPTQDNPLVLRLYKESVNSAL